MSGNRFQYLIAVVDDTMIVSPEICLLIPGIKEQIFQSSISSKLHSVPADTNKQVKLIMNNSSRYREAVKAFDKANSRDPNRDLALGEKHPKELLYARRMSEWLDNVYPNASEALRLAARCQHIERWIIPREDYPMTRRGYLNWRNDLKKYHAERAGSIMEDVGYKAETIRRVQDLVMKKRLKTDPEAQMLEDVICLVFLDSYFEEFARKHEDDKLISILKKTWRKMSENAQNVALDLDMPPSLRRLIEKAVE